MNDLDKSTIDKLRDIILEVDPRDIIKDAQEFGLEVNDVSDFPKQAHNYWRIDDLADEYVNRTARWCAASGASSGIGGVVTAITLESADIAHMAARLYWLCQRLAVLNGFDPDNPLQRDRFQEIYMLALGLDDTVQTLIKKQLASATKISGLRGSKTKYILKFIMLIVSKLSRKEITKKTTAKFLPVVGAVAGGSLNYFYAKKASRKMRELFRDDFFKNLETQGQIINKNQ